MRIVSLVPNATEILFALGAGDEVVGVSHECDYPPEARTRPILTGSALPPGMAPNEVDTAVSAQLASGASLYTLDEKRLAELAPDLLFTQELCPVCAVSTAQVGDAVAPRWPKVPGGSLSRPDPARGCPRRHPARRRAPRPERRRRSIWSTTCAPASSASSAPLTAGPARRSSLSSGSTRRSSAATGCRR